MQRMTEPGAMQRVADTLPMTAKSGEREHQRMFESVARPIEPCLAGKTGHNACAGVADLILRIT